MTLPKTLAQFDDALKINLEYFVKSTESILNENLGIHSSYDSNWTLEKPLTSSKKLYISVFYTGTVYGEFILSLDEETALKLVKNSPILASLGIGDLSRDEVVAIFSEYLNIIAGDCVSVLSKTFEQLTITAPRALFGSTYFPNVKMGTTNLQTEEGIIQCHFYIDSMGLDISRAYHKSLDDLTDAYYDLEKAMHRLQKQQDIIVQAEKMAALGKMAAGVAHEINNPLSIISVTNSNIRRTLTPLETKYNIASMIDRIDTTVARIAKITDGMRMFAGNVQGKNEILSIDDCVAQTAQFLKEKLAEQSIHFKTDIQKGLLISGKKEQLNEAFLHLFENSIQEIRDNSDKWIQVVASEADGVIQVDFIDSGRGIDPSITDKIFDPFFTTHNLEKKGLGLCVVKGVLVDHGASIQVLKNAKNTTFMMTFPKAV